MPSIKELEDKINSTENIIANTFLGKQLKFLRDELVIELSGCEHLEAKVQHRADTGNFCPQDDSYWLYVDCPTCHTTFIVDSKINGEDNPEYKKLSMKNI